MNRKAKRNKYKNETAVLNFEIKSLRCERDKYIDYWRTANCKNAKLSLDLDKSEEEKNKYKDKYYEQLKKEFLDGTKELLTVSVNVEKNILPYPESINKEYVDNERRKYLCNQIAQYLYDNQQAFQIIERKTYTTYNLVLVQNNPDKRGVTEEDFNNMLERYGNEDYMASQLKARSSNIRLYFGDEIDSPFMR